MNKKPWLVEGNPWGTEAKFISWVRGVLRSGWSKHPLKLEYIKRHKTRIRNTNPKSSKTHPTVWGMVCEQCKQPHVQGNIEIDHKGDVQGRFTTMAEIEGYARHLFMIDYDSLQAVCKPCHKIISYAQNKGISFEEASIEKDVIAICKKKVKEVVDFCKAYHYTDAQLSNPDKRRAAVSKILRSV